MLYRRPPPLKPQPNWFKRHESAVKITLTVLGLFIGLHQYLERQHDNRIQRSLDIYERYQAKAVLTARLGIDKVWNTPEFWKELTARHDANGRLSFADTTDLALIQTQDRKIVDHLYVVWSISSEASLCLIRGQCDQVTICQSFFHDTQKYYGFFEPYFDARKTAWDERTQDREGTTNRILNNYCGNEDFRSLYENLLPSEGLCGAWNAARRTYYEGFNVLVGSMQPDSKTAQSASWVSC